MTTPKGTATAPTCKVYTRSAGVLDLFDPEQIKRLAISDLVYGIGSRRRYGAQVPFTVLQHSILVAAILFHHRAPTHVVLAGLLHDLSEGLLGDMQKPIRDAMDPDSVWERAHRAINRRIGQVYDLPEGWECVQAVEEADHVAFLAEVEALVPSAFYVDGFTPGGWIGQGEYRKRVAELGALSEEEVIRVFEEFVYILETLPKVYTDCKPQVASLPFWDKRPYYVQHILLELNIAAQVWGLKDA